MSSNTDNTTKEWRDANSHKTRDIYGTVRRMAIKLTSVGFWRAVGHLLEDGRTREARDVEVFSGIGFYARPKQGANAEAVIVNVGGAANPIAVAVRDEDTRKAVADIDQDETAMFNTLATVTITKAGIVEIRLDGGITQSTILGQTYRTAEDTLLVALGTFATAIGALNPATSASAATTLNAAIATFQAAAASYLTQVAKVQ